MKKLFIEILPLSAWSNDFHELALLLEINEEIKAAYHYRIKLDKKPYDFEYLERQGYTPREIENNPQDFYEVYGDIVRLLETYINFYEESDCLLIYSWSKRSNSIFRNFLNNNGLKNISGYLSKFPIVLNTVIMERYPKELFLIKNNSLDSFTESLGMQNSKRDALSRLVTMYKMYKSLGGVQK